MPEQYSEKRKYPRIEKTVDFKLKTKEDIVAAKMINLSANGAFCNVNKKFSPMTQLGIVFPLIYDKKAEEVEYVECFGVVVRVEEISAKNEIYHIAIFFNDVEASEMDKILKYIKIMNNRPYCSRAPGHPSLPRPREFP